MLLLHLNGKVYCIIIHTEHICTVLLFTTRLIYIYVYVYLCLYPLLYAIIVYVVRSKGSRMKDIMLKKLHSTATTTTSSSTSSFSSAGHTHNSSDRKKNKNMSTNGIGGKGVEEEEEGASKSLLLFLTHRRLELAIEIERLQTHIQSSLTFPPPLLNSPLHTDLSTPNTVLTRIKWQVYTYMNHLSRMLYFGMNGYSDILNDTYTSYTTPIAPADSTTTTGTGTIRYGLGQYLIYALRDKYGLDQLSKEIKRYITATITSSSNSKYYSSASMSESEVQELLSSIKYWKKEVCMKILRVLGQNYDHSDIHNQREQSEMISYTDLFTPLPIHPPPATVSSANHNASEDKSTTTPNSTASSTQLSNSKKRKRMIPSSNEAATNINNNNTSNSNNSSSNIVDDKTGLSSYLSSLPVKLEIGSGSGEHYSVFMCLCGIQVVNHLFNYSLN